MGLGQFFGSIRRIYRNPYIDRTQAVKRHLDWQRRKVMHDFPVELKLSESVLIGKHSSCGVSALVNAHGMYDFNNMLLIKRMLMDGGIFFDVGANVGSYSLIASEQPRARVFAFEPHPATFAALQANLERNGRRNVTAICAAVGALEGTLHISDTPGSSTTHIVGRGDPRAIAVPVVTLAGECGRRGIAPDIVKIDVEGFEDDVLVGMKSALDGVALLVVEINGLSKRRGAGSVVSTARAAGLVGPVYYDAFRSEFRCEPVHDAEDALFIGPDRLRRWRPAFHWRYVSAP